MALHNHEPWAVRPWAVGMLAMATRALEEASLREAGTVALPPGADRRLGDPSKPAAAVRVRRRRDREVAAQLLELADERRQAG